MSSRKLEMGPCSGTRLHFAFREPQGGSVSPACVKLVPMALYPCQICSHFDSFLFFLFFFSASRGTVQYGVGQGWI